MPEILFYFYLIIIFLSILIGIVNYSKYDLAIKTILWLLVITLVNEIATRLYKKEPIYHIFTIFEFSFIYYYFLKTVLVKYYKWIFLFVIILWIVLCVLNMIFLQPFNHLNSNMITLEGFITIGMSLYALYKILINDKIESIITYPHFWFWAFFLVYFSCTFFFWPCIRVLYRNKSIYYNFVIYSQIIINILIYTGIGIILQLYPKMVRNDSR